MFAAFIQKLLAAETLSFFVEDFLPTSRSVFSILSLPSHPTSHSTTGMPLNLLNVSLLLIVGLYKCLLGIIFQQKI